VQGNDNQTADLSKGFAILLGTFEGEPHMIKKPRPSPREFVLALEHESDRGFVLATTAWIEDMLQLVIKATIRISTEVLGDEDARMKKLDEVLSDSRGGLGGLKARTTFCAALGVIDDDQQKQIELLARIRNHFAHFAGPSTLDDPALADEIRSFVQMASYHYDPEGQAMEGDRHWFRMIVLALGAKLIGLVEIIDKKTWPFTIKGQLKKRHQKKAAVKKVKRPNPPAPPRGR
jgi:DNA-binding MltR family transcriptional regulator